MMFYIKIKTGISQIAKHLQTPWGLGSVVSRVQGHSQWTSPKKTKLSCYENILLTGNCHKTSGKKQSKIQNEMLNYIKIAINEENCKLFKK